MSVWSPALYLKFASARLFPALDLLNRTVAVSLTSKLACKPSEVRNVLDLGCGPGNISPFLADAFPNANVYGVDSSPHMIEEAKQTHSKNNDRIQFIVNSVENCTKDSFLNGIKFDVVYSNACLHWLTDHKAIIPQLSKRLLVPSKGIFAAQLPDTRFQHSHLAMDEALNNTALKAKVAGARIPRAEGGRVFYLEALSRDLADVDVWTSEYLHQLPFVKGSENGNSSEKGLPKHPVLNFVKSTGLMPYIDALGGADSGDCKKFLEEYERLLYLKYPPTRVNGSDAVALLSYKRLFLIGRKL